MLIGNKGNSGNNGDKYLFKIESLVSAILGHLFY